MSTRSRRRLVPEVIQTSAMDCGPAALKALLAGFDVAASYDGLRDACQTDVDGSSIDRLERLACDHGLAAEQIMLPAEHVLLPGLEVLPAIVVVRTASGFPHFVVAWSVTGPMVQVMDPARGRVWLPRRRLLSDLYRHRHSIAAADWCDWACSDGFCGALELRLAALKLAPPRCRDLVEQARGHGDWRGPGALDAALRFVEGLTEARTIRRGGEAGDLIAALLTRELAAPGAIPPSFWTIHRDPNDEAGLIFEAAVVVTAGGLTGAAAEPPPSPARRAPAESPERHLWAMLRPERAILAPLLAALALLGLGTTGEILLLRRVLDRDMIADLAGNLGILASFLILMVLLAVATKGACQLLGRRLEVRLRQSLAEKLKTLGDDYFRTRLISDLNQRAYDLFILSKLPDLAGTATELVFGLVFVAVCLAWIVPSGPLAVTTMLAVTIAALVVHHVLGQEHQMRQRTLAGALSRFTLDGLLGLVPLRSHAAERAMRTEQDRMVAEWGRSGTRMVRNRTWILTAQQVGTTLVTIFLVRDTLASPGDTSLIIVVLYLATAIPRLAEALLLMMQQYQLIRITVLRLLEPLTAPAEGESWYADAANPDPAPSTGIAIDGVTVVSGGRTILDGVTCHLGPGEHVAVVGPSGAGKSTLVGLLLGWRGPSAGTVRVDGRLLRGETLAALRRGTAWVDPQVSLWNLSVRGNLAYGLDRDDGVDDAVAMAGLAEVLERFPSPDTPLGENGRLVSGGEGQRVRMGRALARPAPRLVILDEPFRGLDAAARRRLAVHARERWRAATLLHVTHDIADTLDFGRVLVVENGRIVEDGAPAALAAGPSRYRALLDTERQARALLFEHPSWRRLHLTEGRLRC
ncbi:MAG: ATP-binding cassette domain-containing protein [Rhodospirillaceae bacterium]